MEGTSFENACNPTQESLPQSQKRIEREDDEDVRVLEEPVKKKPASAVKRLKGKMLKTEDEDEEERMARWKDDEVEMLIALRGEMHDEFKRNGKKQGVDMWQKFHARLLTQIPTLKKSPVAIKKKFNGLFKAYKEEKLANNVSGESHHECKYYDQFETWFSHIGCVQKHVSVSANDVDSPVEDFVDDMDLDDSLDSTKKKTLTTRASGKTSTTRASEKTKFHDEALALFGKMVESSGKTKFHDEALALFGKMVETSEGLLKSFNRTSDVLINQIDRSLEDFADEKGIAFFLISYVDLLGVLRSKLVPRAAIGKMQKVGAGFAGYAAHFRMTAADPDVMAIPDPKSVIQLPWKKDVAWVASDLYMNGSLLEQSPRQILKNQIKRFAETGRIMKTGVECEFFLLENGGDIKIADSKDAAEKPCYDQGALMRHYKVISELLDHMQTLGWNPYQADHEDANGQFELNWEYDECLATADKHTFFKFMAKSIAEKHGYRATFMPKPFVNKTGNGTHCHVSVWNDNSNLFEDSAGELGLSSLAYNFLAGVLENAQAMVSLLNPTVNSYKRIDGQSTTSGSSWAPCTISYTGNNRTHLLRIPEAGRFELRLADGAVNPYLLQAAILASGLHGIEKKLKPPPRCDWNGHLPPPKGFSELPLLPSNLLEALQNLSTSDVFKKAFGAEFIDCYLDLQRQQWRSYASHLSQWELDTTLDC